MTPQEALAALLLAAMRDFYTDRDGSYAHITLDPEYDAEHIAARLRAAGVTAIAQPAPDPLRECCCVNGQPCIGHDCAYCRDQARAQPAPDPWSVDCGIASCPFRGGVPHIGHADTLTEASLEVLAAQRRVIEQVRELAFVDQIGQPIEQDAMRRLLALAEDQAVARAARPTPTDTPSLRAALDFIADWAHDCLDTGLNSSDFYGFDRIESMARAALAASGWTLAPANTVSPGNASAPDPLRVVGWRLTPDGGYVPSMTIGDSAADSPAPDPLREDYLWVRVRELLNNLGIVGDNIPHRVDEDPGPDLPGEEGAEWCVCGRIWPCEARQLGALLNLAAMEAQPAPDPLRECCCVNGQPCIGHDCAYCRDQARAQPAPEPLREVLNRAHDVAEAADLVIENNYAPREHYDILRWRNLQDAVNAWREAQRAALEARP